MTFHCQVKPVRLSSLDVEKVTFPTDFKSPTPHQEPTPHATQKSPPYSSRLENPGNPGKLYSSRLEISERVFPELPLVHWVQDNSSPPPRWEIDYNFITEEYNDQRFCDNK